MTVTELIKQAAAIIGNQTKLADACEVSQNAIRRFAEDVAAKEAHLPRWVRQ
jgi:hypothetical protein